MSKIFNLSLTHNILAKILSIIKKAKHLYYKNNKSLAPLGSVQVHGKSVHVGSDGSCCFPSATTSHKTNIKAPTWLQSPLKL